MFAFHSLIVTVCFVGLASTASIHDEQRAVTNGNQFKSLAKSCQIEGRDYPSETIVPREHPCHYCVCHEGKVTCYWKNCDARAPVGCKVMDFQDACNPSLYICGIPESVRDSPNQQQTSASGLFAVESKAPLAAITGHSTAAPAAAVAPTTSTPQSAPEIKAIQPPVRHLTPPDPPAFQYRTGATLTTGEPHNLRQGKQEPKEKQPSEFSLRTKQKMRFTRSAFEAGASFFYNPGAALPFGIQEQFPIDFNKDLPRAIVESIRQKRAILGFAEHHHHHHDHPDEPLDRGCVILGVRYDVGDVIGIATDVCQECRCAAQALFCSPKCCFNPAPLRRLTGDDVNNLVRSSADNAPQRIAPHPLHSIMSS